ncbi:MAG: biotin--[acetyl-CoA-carboxylase] ligase [Dehalococcoidia bacterium]
MRSVRIGREVRYAERTASTMDDARAGADRDGERSAGVAYVGGQQTAGRGRQGRNWISEPGAGLYVTYHLVPAVAVEHVPLLAAAGALAVADAARELARLETELKWPNDVLHAGRKLAGVLAEARHGPRLDVFLGIGLNLREAALPPDVRALATSLEAASGRSPEPETALAALSVALEAWCILLERDPSALVEAWRSRLVTLGQPVRLALPEGGTVEGNALDVTSNGELLVRAGNGEVRPYAAGDVTSGLPENNHNTA